MLLKIKIILKNKFLQNVLTLMSGTAIAQVITLIISPILTRYYTPEEFGELAFFTTSVAILAIVSSLRLEHSIMLPKSNDEAIKIYRITVLFSGIVNLCVFFSLFLFGNKINSILFKSDTIWWMYFIPLAAFLNNYYQSCFFIANRYKEYKILSFSKVVQSFSAAVTNILSGVMNISAGLILGNIIGWLFSSNIVGRILMRRNNEGNSINWYEVKSVFSRYRDFPLVSTPHALMNTISSSFPIFSLGYFFSSTITGYYSLGLRIIQLPLGVISSSIQSVLYEKVVNLYNANSKITPFLKKYLLLTFSISIIPYLIFVIAAPNLFAVIFGESWRQAGDYIVILSPWLYIVFLTSPLSFLPALTQMQGGAFKLEIINTVLKIIGLIVGGFFHSVILSLLLFSLAGFLMVSYNLFWYFKLAQRNDLKVV